MKRKKTLIIIAAILIISALVITPTITGAAVIVKGNNVTLHYTGKYDDGTTFDTSIGSEPLSFVIGQGLMIPGFEMEVLGMKVGETKTFTLSPEEAYGNRYDELIIDYNKTELEEVIGSEITEGMVLTGSNGAPVEVIAVNEENATIDLNHPLAGETLTFEVTILNIK